MELTARDNASGYHAKSKSIGTDITVGGKDIPADKFVPAMNASFHSDEYYLDLNHIDSPMTDRTEAHVDGKVKHAAIGAGGQRFNHEFYTTDDNTIKWDMLFDSPADAPDIIRFRIKASKGLMFLKQIISPEDLANGNQYSVPEAEGSYAVYIDGKRDNKYQTGKVCHIYSPFYIDEDGNRSPLLDMNITPDGDNAKMLILSDTPEVTAWKNDPIRARHQLRLDPILGYDTVGVLVFTQQDFMEGNIFTSDANGGIINALHIALYQVATAPSDGVKLAVCDCNQINGDPSGQAVITQVEGAGFVSDDWNISVSGSPTIQPNTDYYVSWLIESSLTRMKYDSLTPRILYFKSQAYAGGFLDPLPLGFAGVNSGIIISIWADYDPVSTAAIPPHIFARVR